MVLIVLHPFLQRVLTRYLGVVKHSAIAPNSVLNKIRIRQHYTRHWGINAHRKRVRDGLLLDV